MRFKNDDQEKRKEKRHSKRKRSRSPTREKKKKHKRHKPKYYTPPKIYEEEEGWIPPSTSHIDDDEKEWREKLFDAMAEDEGQDAYAYQYDQYAHSSRSREDLMDEEEYRQYIVNGMYRKRHAEEIGAEEALRKERKRQEKERKRAQERMKKEQERQEALLKQVMLRDARDVYDKKWEELENKSTVTEKDIPWPVRGDDFTLHGVREFLVDETQPAETNRKTVRKEQLRYHPDKFIHRVIRRFHGKDSTKERVTSRMNEISGLLNELWKKLADEYP